VPPKPRITLLAQLRHRRAHVVIWRPLFVDSDGRVVCDACNASAEQIGKEVRIRLGVIKLLEGLGIS
jgi:hypothetical protein